MQEENKGQRPFITRSIPKVKVRAGSKGITILGAVFLVFAIIGVFTVVNAAVRGTRDIIGRTAEKESIAAFLKPVVMFDPVPFSDLSEANGDTMLLSSIWAALLSENMQTNIDENGMIILPAPDVEFQAHRLYGTADMITHRNVDDYELMYMYEPDTNVYRIPVATKIAYSPEVDTITKNGDLLTVRVGYVPPGNAWFASDDDEGTPEPDKYMIYELKKIKDGFNIVSIKDSAEEAFS